MNVVEFTGLVLVISSAAGFLGALTGMGGGVVIVPVLTMFLGADIRYAIGASLVSVIATSSGAAAAYVKEGFSNIRIGMFLEMATTLGALIGASLVALIPATFIAVIFGLVLIYSATLALQSRRYEKLEDLPDPLASRLHMDGAYPGDLHRGNLWPGADLFGHSGAPVPPL